MKADRFILKEILDNAEIICLLFGALHLMIYLNH
jgi:hypothetical protein